MRKVSAESVKMKVFPKGQVVIPVSLRKKYRIEIGDKIDVVPTSQGILLKATRRNEKAGPLTDRLFGIFGNFLSKEVASDEDIDRVVAEGFSEKWTK